MESMIHVCLENKITTLTCRYFMVTPLNWFRKSIFFQQNSERKNTAYIQMWDSNAGWKPRQQNQTLRLPKSHIIWSVEQSLKNLQTDYLDVFLLHRPSPLMQQMKLKR
jgi:predicted oxidoreductase